MTSPINSITFFPAQHAADSFETDVGLKVAPGEDPRLALLRSAAPEQHDQCSELLYSSLPNDPDTMRDVLPQRNGFVQTVTTAYNQHRALTIRPDDVWLAILTQFCFFVNGNAEALRSTFVADGGKKKLVVMAIGNRYTMNPVLMAQRMTELMEEHIVDESLREWIVPSFSTTTATDKSISAILMMGTMKEYFAYKFKLRCGIPRVTIEGSKSDWEEILRRLERLKKYGEQTATWYNLLRPIISRFITAYDDPTTQSNLDFWNKVAHRSGGGSGPTWLSGWITALCVFDEKGNWQGNRLGEGQPAGDGPNQETPYLVLDGIPYPTIDSNDIPCGYTYVDVKLDDNGVLFDTMFVAGLIGSQIGSAEPAPNDERNAVRPFPAWWYFIKREGSKRVLPREHFRRKMGRV